MQGRSEGGGGISRGPTPTGSSLWFRLFLFKPRLKHGFHYRRDDAWGWAGPGEAPRALDRLPRRTANGWPDSGLERWLFISPHACLCLWLHLFRASVRRRGGSPGGAQTTPEEQTRRRCALMKSFLTINYSSFIPVIQYSGESDGADRTCNFQA